MSDLNSFSVNEHINASKPKVWEALFDRFGDIQVFNPNITSSNYLVGESGNLGTERYCQLDSKTYVKEKITNVNGTDSFTIDIYDGNLPMMEKMIAVVDVYEKDKNETEVKFTFSYSTSPGFMAPLMKSPMKSRMSKLLIGLKYHLETGKTLQETSFKSIYKDYKRLEPSTAFTA